MPIIVRKHLEWMRQRGLAESTIEKRRLVLSRVAAFTGGPPCRASHEQLQAWRASLTAGDDAIAADLSHVRMFYRWCYMRELIDYDPAEGLVRPRLSRRLPRPIPEDRLLHALAQAPARIRPMLVLAGWAGLRACEIAWLRRERVFETRQPPGILVASDATKGRHERYVPMSEFVLAELVPVLPPSGWIFRKVRTRGPMGPNNVSHVCNLYLHSLGLAETLHTLRHRFASAALDVNPNIRVAQELLGHQHLSSTAIYTRVTSAAAAATVQAIPAPGHLRVVSRFTERAVDQ